MQQYKKVAINITFLTIILSAGILGNRLVNLNQDSGVGNLNSKKNTKYSQGVKEKLLNTFENNDYQSWRQLIGKNHKLNNIIDESAFNKFVAARLAARNGRYDEAIQITEVLKKKVEDKLG